MEKDLFKKSFEDSLDKNFNRRANHFEIKLHSFNELGGIIFEINKCLLLEFHRASITLTNNLLERLLKLALIYNETGIGPKPVNTWGDIFEGPHKKYTGKSLGNSIELCRKFDLITETEKKFLFEIIRELMRNGFSHADSTKILNDLPDQLTMIQGNLTDPKDIKPVSVNHKVIPFIEAIHIENFAKDNAENYFEYVVELIQNIDKRLQEKA